MKADRNTILLKRPSSVMGDPFCTALPAGNGRTGVLMTGAAAHERILINRGDLWTEGSESCPLPDISSSLGEMRSLIERGQYAEAQNIMCDALAKEGYSASIGFPIPMCILNIESTPESKFTQYSRGIKMDRAELFTKWCYGENKNERRLFVSRSDDIIYLRINSSIANSFYFSLPESDNSEAAQKIYERADFSADKESRTLVFSSDVGGKSFGAVACFSSEAMLSEEKGHFAVQSGEYTVLIKTFYGEDMAELVKQISSELFAVTAKADCYRTEMTDNIVAYSKLYNSVSISLAEKEEHRKTNEEHLDDAYYDSASPALLEKLWRYARYVFICGNADGGLPFALYGLWHYKYNQMWSQNVANENVQLIYRFANAGGLSYAYKALIDYYCSDIGQLEKNAKQLFGCNGIFVPAYTSPKCFFPCVNVPVILNWVSAAGWISLQFYDYYLYTSDKELFEEKILPFMCKAADFYLDYVCYDSYGRTVIYPSVSPENTPGNLIKSDSFSDMEHQCPAVKNATMDISIIRELLTALIVETDGIKEAAFRTKRSMWCKLLDALPLYSANRDGAVKEWQSDELDENYNHRHLSHIFPLFPGNEIAPSDSRLYSFEKAVSLRELNGQSGWSLSHMAAVYARLGKIDSSLDCLDTLCKGCLLDNFFTVHNDWRDMGVSLTMNSSPVQLDALMGVAEAIQELCCRYINGKLYILPSGEKRFENLKITDMHMPFGLLSVENTPEKKLIITIYSYSDGEITVVAHGREEKIKLKKENSSKIKI